ncbi:hypothetical protein EDB87DRAFT_1580438 [Lactarius vividus]|nr:hypothetical protein EDB87DRAFT_1580438 [Lactarius vividus]
MHQIPIYYPVPLSATMMQEAVPVKIHLSDGATATNPPICIGKRKRKLNEYRGKADSHRTKRPNLHMQTAVDHEFLLPQQVDMTILVNGPVQCKVVTRKYSCEYEHECDNSPPQSEVIIGADGLWGVHEWMVYPQFHHPEFPYLAWIPLHSSNTTFPSNIITHSIDKSMWQAHLNKSNIHSVHWDVLDELMVKWKLTKAALEDPFSTISSNLSSVWCPRQVYNRAFEVLS